MRIPLVLVAALLLILWITTAVVYPDLPAQIPTHFNASLKVDGWNGKPSWFLIPTVATAVAALLIGLGALAPKNPGIFNFPGKERLMALAADRRGPATRHIQAMMEWIALVVVTTMVLVQYVIFEAAHGRDATVWIPIAVALSLVGSIVAIVLGSKRVEAAVEEAGG